jgi:hypothetical protein
MTGNNWDKWQNHVLAELDRLNTNVERTEEKNTEEHKELFTSIATLKVKAGIWGAIAGLIPGSVALIWFFIWYLGK